MRSETKSRSLPLNLNILESIIYWKTSMFARQRRRYTIIEGNESTQSTVVDSYRGSPLVGPRRRSTCCPPHILTITQPQQGAQGKSCNCCRSHFNQNTQRLRNQSHYNGNIYYLAHHRLLSSTSLWWVYVFLIFMLGLLFITSSVCDVAPSRDIC